MLLAIDIGNTQIVAGCLEDTDIRNIARFETRHARTEYEYAVILKQTLEFAGVDCRGIEGAIIASVVPGLTPVLRRAVELLTGKKAMVVGSGIKTGLNILIENPAQLGSDMVACSVAALAAYPPPIIIIDMGTATTISVIGANGSYLGGALVPGLSLSLTALASTAAQLQDVPLEAPGKVIGKNTIACMQSGAIYGTAATVDGMIDRIQDELGAQATAVATGDMAGRVIPSCRHKITVDNELLLRGLGIIYKRNKKQ